MIVYVIMLFCYVDVGFVENLIVAIKFQVSIKKNVINMQVLYILFSSNKKFIVIILISLIFVPSSLKEKIKSYLEKLLFSYRGIIVNISHN